MTVELILTIFLILLTAAGIGVAVQLFLLLRDARKSVPKVDKILTDISQITDSIAKPAAAISGISAILKKFIKK